MKRRKDQLKAKGAASRAMRLAMTVAVLGSTVGVSVDAAQAQPVDTAPVTAGMPVANQFKLNDVLESVQIKLDNNLQSTQLKIEDVPTANQLKIEQVLSSAQLKIDGIIDAHQLKLDTPPGTVDGSGGGIQPS